MTPSWRRKCRACGHSVEESGTEAVMTKVAERMQTAGQSLEYTQEYSRVGAIKGIVQYADGSKLDLFIEYDIAVPPTIDMGLESTVAMARCGRSARKSCARWA